MKDLEKVAEVLRRGEEEWMTTSDAGCTPLEQYRFRTETFVGVRPVYSSVGLNSTVELSETAHIFFPIMELSG